MGRPRHGRRALPLADRDRRSTPPATVYVLDSENNRVQVFSVEWAVSCSAGATAGRASGSSHSPPRSPSAAKETSTWPTRTTTASSASNPSSRPAAGAWRRAPGRRRSTSRPVLSVKLLRPGGVLARRGLSLTVACQRGCKVLVTATLAPSAGQRRAVKLIAVARGLPGSPHRPCAPARRAAPRCVACAASSAPAAACAPR